MKTSGTTKELRGVNIDEYPQIKPLYSNKKIPRAVAPAIEMDHEGNGGGTFDYSYSMDDYLSLVGADLIV